MYNIHHSINKTHQDLVVNSLKNRGIGTADIRPGNDCIWVTYRYRYTINEYFIIANDCIVNIISD